jgi:hypothetical protein
MTPQVSMQLASVDSVSINPTVDGLVTDTHQLVIRIINDQPPGDFLWRPVINEFAVNIVN